MTNFQPTNDEVTKMNEHCGKCEFCDVVKHFHYCRKVRSDSVVFRIIACGEKIGIENIRVKK